MSTTGWTVRRRLAVVITALATLAGVLVPATASSGATAPPPVSNITVTERTAHRVAISYYVPAAYYSPGGGGVVRLTRGYTPAASPTSGYAVPVTGRTARTTLDPALTRTWPTRSPSGPGRTVSTRPVAPSPSSPGPTSSRTFVRPPR